MVGSTTPALEQSEEHSDWHPVHRANALLRQALQSTTESFETLEARYGVESLSSAIESVMQGVQITYPTPLATRFESLEAEEKTIPSVEAWVPVREAPGDETGDAGDDTIEDWVPDAQDDGPSALPAERIDDTDDGQDFDESELLASELALEPTLPLSPRQLHMRTLMGEFRRRQHYVSLLVAASIATAVLLTVGGVVLTVSLTSSPPSASDRPAPPPSTSAQSPGTDTASNKPATVSVAKAEPAIAPAQEDPASRQPVDAEMILAASGREIAFGPLLPASHARYFLIRGLPSRATLSAGQQSGTGTWMVKGDRIAGLSLSLGKAAIGDYPLEVYSLESGDGPQVRQSYMLRVTPSNPTLASASFAPSSHTPAAGLPGPNPSD